MRAENRNIVIKIVLVILDFHREIRFRLNCNFFPFSANASDLRNKGRSCEVPLSRTSQARLTSFLARKVKAEKEWRKMKRGELDRETMVKVWTYNHNQLIRLCNTKLYKKNFPINISKKHKFYNETDIKTKGQDFSEIKGNIFLNVIIYQSTFYSTTFGNHPFGTGTKERKSLK